MLQLAGGEQVEQGRGGYEVRAAQFPRRESRHVVHARLDISGCGVSGTHPVPGGVRQHLRVPVVQNPPLRAGQ